MDTQKQNEPGLSLLPKEKVLWESEGGADKPDKVAWGFILFWAVFFVILTGILISLLLESLSSFQTCGQTFYVLGGLMIAGLALYYLAKQILKEIGRDTKMNYAITNQRLVVANSSGSNRQFFTGRPFSSMQVEHKGDLYDFTLRGIGEDKDEVVVQMLGVRDGAKVEKLLLSRFLADS